MQPSKIRLVNLWLLVLIFLPLGYGLPQTAVAVEDVDNIIVSGNRRSKDAYIKKLVRSCSRDGASLLEIQECLDSRGLFNDVEVTRNSAGQLEVSLKDKWTFIPIPRYQSTSSPTGETEQSVGITVLESNLGGWGNVFVGNYDNEINSGKSAFSLILVLTDLGYWGDISVAIAAAQRRTELQQFAKRDLVYELNELTSFLRVGVTQSLGIASINYGVEVAESNFHDSQLYQPRSRSRRATSSRSDLVPDLNEPHDEVNYNKYSLNLGYGLGGTTRRNYYNAGATWSQEIIGELLDYTQAGGTPRGSANPTSPRPPLPARRLADYKLESSLYLGVPSARSQVFQLFFEHKIRDDDTAFGAYKIGGRRGTRGIQPQSLWGNHYASLALEYQIPIYQTRPSTATFAPFIDLGYMDGIPQQSTRAAASARPGRGVSGDRFAWWLSGGLAVYFYFNRVAIPAFGFYTAYSPDYTGPIPNFGFLFATQI